MPARIKVPPPISVSPPAPEIVPFIPRVKNPTFIMLFELRVTVYELERFVAVLATRVPPERVKGPFIVDASVDEPEGIMMPGVAYSGAICAFNVASNVTLRTHFAQNAAFVFLWLSFGTPPSNVALDVLSKQLCRRLDKGFGT